eukprot:SAG25_NODE_14611_length_253_cov_0.571429_1_plen_35_part_10
MLQSHRLDRAVRLMTPMAHTALFRCWCEYAEEVVH